MLYYSHFVIASSVTTFKFLTDLQLLYLDAVDNFLNYGSLHHRPLDDVAVDHGGVDHAHLNPEPLFMNRLVLNPSIPNPLIMGPSIIGRRLCRLPSIRIISLLQSWPPQSFL